MYDTISLLRLREFKRDVRQLPLAQACQKHIQSIRDEMRHQYFSHPEHHRTIAAQLIFGLALDIDSIIITIWRHLNLHLEQNISLVAIGGYGRRELHPYSDIDLLVYHHQGRISAEVEERVQRFIRLLWDIDLQAAVTMRNDKDIRRSTKADITLTTSLLEARLLIGDRTSVHTLRRHVYERSFSIRAYFLGKRQEQIERHLKYNNISYQLEPNIKNSPGGLRDLHTIIWIAKYFLRGSDFDQLVEEQLISHSGMRKLSQSRNFLWSMRLGVHLLAGRSEERFLVDYQRDLARLLGYKDTAQQRAVEALMQQYYQSILAISAVNDSTMQKFEENILLPTSRRQQRKIDEDFYVIGTTMYCVDERCFERNPSNLLRCFLLLGKTQRATSFSAVCIHSIYENSLLIDDTFRADPVNQHLFMQILSLPQQLGDIFELMKRYGVLGHYLPSFANIIGQIQHDLFHIYTVDAHTLQIIRNLQALLVQEQERDLEIPAQAARRLPQFPLVIIAGLFHDIAKGRGGDHSILGAQDIAEFSRAHGVSENDVDLLSWLVKYHLRMSALAQGKDLSDPEVISGFGRFVENKVRLDYLYVLTVADIMATNPSLWNSWRAALLTRLYLDTRSYLDGQHTPTIEAMIRDKQSKAVALLSNRDQNRAQEFWQLLENDFFINKSPENMAWQTSRVLKFREHKEDRAILVMIRPTHQLMSQGATEIAIYSLYQPMTFADIVYTLDRVHLDIQEARIHNTSDGYVFDSFIVLDEEHKPLPKSRYAQVRESLESVFTIKDIAKRPKKAKRYISQRLQKFWFAPRMQIEQRGDRYHLQISCLDCPGLLATIAETFRTLGCEVTNARINTIGEEARDTFVAQSIRDQLDCKRIELAMVEAINVLTGIGDPEMPMDSTTE